MIYCYDKDLKLLGTFITHKNISSILKFCLNRQEIYCFILSKSNVIRKIDNILKIKNSDEFSIVEDKIFITKDYLLKMDINKFLSIDDIKNKLINIKKFKEDCSTIKKIKMFGIVNTLNIGNNRGPCIQTKFKEKMFSKLTDIEIDLGFKHQNYH